MTDLHFGIITGLTLEENRQLATLAEVFNYHQPYNETKDKYYEGHITLNDVNIGIALPDGIKKLEVGCNWGQKTVDVLAARSMFDGFVGKNTEALTQLQRRLCGTAKKGASTAGLPSLTPCRMSSSRGAGCPIWSTFTPMMRSLCWKWCRGNGMLPVTGTAWAAR